MNNDAIIRNLEICIEIEEVKIESLRKLIKKYKLGNYFIESEAVRISISESMNRRIVIKKELKRYLFTIKNYDKSSVEE